MIRWLLMVSCLVASSSWASVIPLNPPPNIMGTPAGYITTGPVAMNSAATAVEMRAAVGWGTVAFPATMTLGEGATAVALNVLRATPALATAAALTYLAQIGIQKCLDGSWCKRASNPSSSDPGFTGYVWRGAGGDFNSAQAACIGAAAVNQVTFQSVTVNGPNGACLGKWINDGSPAGWGVSQVAICVSGYVMTNGVCGPDPNAGLVPATDADWNKGLTYPISIGLASDMAAAKAPIPVNITLNPDPATGRPAPKTVNLGDPYQDPVTGKWYRDIAIVTPNADGKTATLTTAKQETDANGNPVTDPNTGGGKAPEPQTDPCSGHETRMDCVEQGQIPDAPDIKEKKINVAITPDAGWGPDNGSCPVDIPLVFLGHAMSFSWSSLCSFFTMVRPIVLALAWLGAALILVGARQGGE